MEIKPLYDTATITFTPPVRLNPKKLFSKFKSQDELIPGGALRVIKLERRKNLFFFIIYATLFLTTAIWLLIDSVYLKRYWGNYIIPGILIIFSIVKLIYLQFDRKWLINSVSRYKEDLKRDLNATPGFFEKIYIRTIKNRIAQNWIVFILSFYIIIFTLVLYGLKDVSWYFLDFKTWIKNSLKSPYIVIWSLSSIVILMVALSICINIFRKKKILEIEAFLGNKLTSRADFEKIKSDKNKFWRRIFLISVLIILVLPVLVWAVLKYIKRKKV